MSFAGFHSLRSLIGTVALSMAFGGFAKGAEDSVTAKKSAGKANKKAGAPPVRPEFLLRQFDRDGDGKLSRDEAPERIRQAFARIDQDGDQKLSTPELQRMMESMNRRGPAEQASNAKLPKNLDAIKPKKARDRDQLALRPVRTLGHPLTVADLDDLIDAERASEGVATDATPISDAQFIRRVYLDLIGRLPAPADVHEYVAATSADKKSALVDRLLALPQFGENWARYWRDVIGYRATAGQNRLFPFDAEPWLADAFNQNTDWGTIVRQMLSAQGLSTEVPQGFFIAAHEAVPEELAGETTRVFLGIQISCAQCHDHPTDTWKRDQFHELASFFGKADVRIRRDLGNGPRGPIVEIATSPRKREYRKVDLLDPSKPGEVVAPVFLSGQAIPENTSDEQRRSALAGFLTSKQNPYFAKAFVNRVWSELLGTGFTNPVDDLGAHVEVVHPELFDALAGSFAADSYNIKNLFRTIVLSKAYAAPIRSLDDSPDPLLAVTPTRLTADQIFDSLDWVLGDIVVDEGASGPRRLSPRRRFEQTFGFDPSTDAAEIEGTIPQALELMNNPMIQRRLRANEPDSLLSKLLATSSDDRQIVRKLYERVLARNPADEEAAICLQHVASADSRAEGFEDLLWALVNSTEFMTNH